MAETVTMTALTARPMPTGLRYALIVSLALAMGAQNATARKLAVPDLTTTVLTLTITGIAADGPIAGATGARVARRLISVAAMLLGALAGALFVLHVHIVYPLVIALVILAAVAVTAVARARTSPRTQRRSADASCCPVVRRDDTGTGRPVPGDPQRPARAGPARGPARHRRRRPGRPVQRHAVRARGRSRAAGTRRGDQVPDRAAPRIREMGILVVAQAWDSAYERSSHEPIGREAGLTEPEIEALRAGADPGFADEQERVAYQVVRALVGPADLDDQQYDVAARTLGEQALVELSTLVGYYATLALQLRIFRVGGQ